MIYYEVFYNMRLNKIILIDTERKMEQQYLPNTSRSLFKDFIKMI